MGVFDSYIADLLPFSEAPTDQPYRRSYRAVLYQDRGPVVTLTSTRNSGS